jgi:hypothetical protein
MQVVTTLELQQQPSQFTTVADLVKIWHWQLVDDYPQQSAATRESILYWLVEQDLDRLAQLNPQQLKLVRQGIAYRYRVLTSRYLGQAPERAYRRLLTRLASIPILQNKIRTLVALSRDCQRPVVEVLQEFLQDLLQRDRYLKQQMLEIAKCTDNSRLHHALLFTTIEEYCLRPIRNQPLIVYRFINYMRRLASAGVTHVPEDTTIRLVFDPVSTEDNDSFSLLDAEALVQYCDRQAIAEQQMWREEAKQKLADYLEQKLGTLAVQWLQMYLQGQPQQAIACQLNLPIKDVYRLREKVCYHAMRLFSYGELRSCHSPKL